MKIGDREFIEAIGRNDNEEKQHSHLYIKISPPSDIASMTYLGATTGYLPMCRYGWNRSNGEGFSIFRGHTGDKGLCKICGQRARQGLPGIEAKTGSHKTKWL